MQKRQILNLFLTGIIAASASSCIEYHQGDFSDGKDLEVPAISSQSKVFFINPPIRAKIGESNDDQSIRARASGAQNLACVQYENYAWKPNTTSPAAQNSSPIMPQDLQTDFKQNATSEKTNPKVKKRAKISKNEFTIDMNDLSLYQNNPNPLEIIESVNVFSGDILPQKITGESLIDNVPQMLLRYMKYLNDGSNLKITSVTSVKKISGAFYGDRINKVKDKTCGNKVINGIQMGAALSIAISLKFQKSEDKEAFEQSFGDDNPFARKASEASDQAMSESLANSKAEIELVVAQIGGDAEKIKKYVSNTSCKIDKLDECRKARRSIFQYFFNEVLQPPTSPDQTNGWMPVQLETTSLPARH